MKTAKHKIFIGLLVVFTGLVSCEKLMPTSPSEDELLDGPVEGLTTAQNRQHAAGDEAFTDQVFTSETGLGPLFVATKCGSCHAGDGKGVPFTTLTRFGKNDSLGTNEFDHGPQLQDRAIPGYMPETLPLNTPHAKFTPPINTGLGFLELVSEDDILAMAAVNVNNVDGVRGHPNWAAVPSYVVLRKDGRTQGNRVITRFGKKGSAYDLFHQTVFAYNQDMGITTSFDPTDAYSLKTIDPEISDKTVRDVVFYLQTLKAPIQRNQNNFDVIQGGALFGNVGCESCHKKTLRSGYSPVEAQSNKDFHPYTDLLVHDMGPGLDDGYTEGSAKGSEWRTAPLWGLGLAPNSQGGQFYLLHDGRARSIEEAIMLHGGEASSARKKYTTLSQGEKSQLINFLKSL